jgi:hypothetical protein
LKKKSLSSDLACLKSTSKEDRGYLDKLKSSLAGLLDKLGAQQKQFWIIKAAKCNRDLGTQSISSKKRSA